MAKITKFPASLDTELDLPDISLLDMMDAEGIEHDVQHTLLNQAVVELQKKVGKDNSEDEASLDFRVKNLEENGTGGAGLAPLDDQNPMFVELNPSQEIPENPSIWLEVVISGVRFAVPAFKVIRPPEPPGSFDSEANASIYYPKTFAAADDFDGEFTPEPQPFQPKNLTVKDDWTGTWDGEDV